METAIMNINGKGYNLFEVAQTDSHAQAPQDEHEAGALTGQTGADGASEGQNRAVQAASKSNQAGAHYPATYGVLKTAFLFLISFLKNFFLEIPPGFGPGSPAPKAGIIDH